MKKARRRQDHQHRLDDVDLRRLLRAGLRREQGRHRAAHQVAGRPPGPRTTSRSTPSCRAGSTPTLTAGAREQVPGLHERVLARTPAGRWGVPDDFAGIAVFLASAGLGLRHRHRDPGRRRLRLARLSGEAHYEKCIDSSLYQHSASNSETDKIPAALLLLFLFPRARPPTPPREIASAPPPPPTHPSPTPHTPQKIVKKTP